MIDEDLERMSREERSAEIARLRDGIRARGDAGVRA